MITAAETFESCLLVLPHPWVLQGSAGREPPQPAGLHTGTQLWEEPACESGAYSPVSVSLTPTQCELRSEILKQGMHAAIPCTQVSQNAPLECSEATEGFGVPGRTKPSSSTSDRGEISSFSALTAIVWHVKARWTSSTKLRGTVSMHWKAVRTHLISMMLPLAFGARSSRLGKDRRWQNSQQRQVLSAHSTGPATSSSYRASPEGTPHRGFQDFTPHWKQTSRAYHFLLYFFKAVVQVSTCVNHTERIYSKQYLSFGSGRWGAFSPSIWNLPWLGVAFGFYTKNKTKLNQKKWKKIESWTICNHKKHNHTRYTHATTTFSLPLVY